MTDNSTYTAYVENKDGLSMTDQYGNTYQLYLITLSIAKQNASDTIKEGVLTDVIPEGFTFVSFVNAPANASHQDGKITYSGISGDTSLRFLVLYTGGDSGVLYTNTSASFSYQFVVDDTTTLNMSQYFPQPVAGINPATVNDVDVVKSGDTQTINVLANDLFTHTGLTLSDYTVSDKTVYLTDADGNKLSEEELSALDLKPEVNDDGSITYTAPKQYGDGTAYELYYVVEAKVTEPDGSTYADGNETTLTSRVTKVTIYSVEDQYIVVDFGLPTADKVYADIGNTMVADGVTLAAQLSVSGMKGSSEYGTITTSNSTYSFTPGTTNFNGTCYYSYTVSTKDTSTYVTTVRSIDGGVTVIPANNLYYEENFLRWVDTTGEDSDGNAVVTNAWTTLGSAVSEKQSVANKLYGYDSTYEPEADKAAENYSNGSEKCVTVTADNYEADAYFTFTGTGFDVYSECNSESGVLVAEIYTYEENAENHLGTRKQTILMDTYLASGSYYQIPVIMYRTQNYGTYVVKLRAFYNAVFDHNYASDAEKSAQRDVRKLLGLDPTGELICLSMDDVGLPVSRSAQTRSETTAVKNGYYVYIDAIRVYNPLNNNLDATKGIAYTAYTEANELNPVFENINDTVMDAASWQDAGGQVKGILFLASRDDNAGSGDTFSSDAVCLGAGGEILKTEEKDANGRYYLLDSDGNRITYEYEAGKTADVYMKELTITSDTLAESQTGRAFYYDADTDGDGEVEAVALTAAQLRKLDIVCYDSTYEAIGPENEIYLKNGQGLAFDVPNGASVQISAKVPYGGSAEIWAYKNGWIEAAVVVNSRTEMYYDMSSYVSGGKLILKCVATDTTTVLSLCNAKGIGVTRGASLMTVTSGTVRAAVDAFDDPKEHVHSYTDVVTAPTCTEQGYTTHTCECDDSFVDSYVDALGHAWNEGVVTQEPTATQDGVKTYTCTRCGETRTEPIPVTGETEKPCDGGEGCPSTDFTDISTKAWYHLSVDYAVTHGLMDGVGNGLFAPEEDMTRAMLVTVLWRFEGKPEAGKSPFTDVPEGEWYTEAVAWAAENGIVDGIGGGRFDPDGKITREQMATILYRYAKKNGMDTEKRDELSGYPDAEKVSAYAEEAVKWTVAEAIINGSDGTLLPQSAATRAQVATILMRFIENIAKQ